MADAWGEHDSDHIVYGVNYIGFQGAELCLDKEQNFERGACLLYAAKTCQRKSRVEVGLLGALGTVLLTDC